MRQCRGGEPGAGLGDPARAGGEGPGAWGGRRDPGAGGGWERGPDGTARGGLRADGGVPVAAAGGWWPGV